MHRTKKEKTLMMPTSLPLTAAFIEIPPNAYTGLAVSLMFLAGEAEHIGGRRTSKKKHSRQTKEDARLLKKLVLLSTQEQSASPATECGEGGQRVWLLSKKREK